MTRTDFILAAACGAAEETLEEAKLVHATPEVFAEFVARLDAAVEVNNGLKRTMRARAPWAALSEAARRCVPTQLFVPVSYVNF